jgi:hypothetical protein
MNAKLDTGRVFERMFRIYGDQFTLLIPAALVLFIPVSLVIALLLAGGGVLAGLLALVISVVASFWYQGMVVEAVRDIIDGRRDHTIGSLFSAVSPVIAPLTAVGLLAGLGIGIGLLLIVIPGLILATIWAVVIPAVVIERTGVFEAFGRSRGLVRGNGWRVFGVIVVVILLLAILNGTVNAIVGGASDDSFVAYWIADLVVRALVAPLLALAVTVLYVELRRIKGEALAEDTTSGVTEPPTTAPAGPEAPAV